MMIVIVIITRLTQYSDLYREANPLSIRPVHREANSLSIRPVVVAPWLLPICHTSRLFLSRCPHLFIQNLYPQSSVVLAGFPFRPLTRARAFKFHHGRLRG
jgi:hypothetical protein